MNQSHWFAKIFGIRFPAAAKLLRPSLQCRVFAVVTDLASIVLINPEHFVSSAYQSPDGRAARIRSKADVMSVVPTFPPLPMHRLRWLWYDSRRVPC